MIVFSYSKDGRIWKKEGEKYSSTYNVEMDLDDKQLMTLVSHLSLQIILYSAIIFFERGGGGKEVLDFLFFFFYIHPFIERGSRKKKTKERGRGRETKRKKGPYMIHNLMCRSSIILQDIVILGSCRDG